VQYTESVGSEAGQKTAPAEKDAAADEQDAAADAAGLGAAVGKLEGLKAGGGGGGGGDDDEGDEEKRRKLRRSPSPRRDADDSEEESEGKSREERGRSPTDVEEARRARRNREEARRPPKPKRLSRQELQQQLQEQRERADKLAQEMEGMKVGARAREPRAISTKSMEGLKEFTGDSSAKVWINRARDLLELAKMSPADEVLALKTKLSQPVYTVMDLRLKERVQQGKEVNAEAFFRELLRAYSNDADAVTQMTDLINRQQKYSESVLKYVH